MYEAKDFVWITSLHTKLKETREALGLTAEQAAAEIGITAGRYIAYETGRWHLENAHEDVRRRVKAFIERGK